MNRAQQKKKKKKKKKAVQMMERTFDQSVKAICEG